MNKAEETNFEWDIRVPIFKNKIILKQLGIAIGIPFGILLIALFILKAYYGIILIGLLFVFTIILVLIIFRASYDIHFSISGKGILCENQPKQQERVERVALMTIFMGLLSKNVTAMGIGMISSQRTRVFIPWKNIRRIRYADKKSVIMIYGGFGQNIVLFCESKSYLKIKEIISKGKCPLLKQEP